MPMPILLLVTGTYVQERVRELERVIQCSSSARPGIEGRSHPSRRKCTTRDSAHCGTSALKPHRVRICYAKQALSLPSMLFLDFPLRLAPIKQKVTGFRTSDGKGRDNPGISRVHMVAGFVSP